MNDQPLYKSSLDRCPLTFALNLLGGKWRLPVIGALNKNGTIRYNEVIQIINHRHFTEN